MASSSAVADDILPEESASNVSRVSTTSTQYVRASRRAAAAAKRKIRRQQELELEKSMLELENEETLSRIHRERSELALIAQHERSELALKAQQEEADIRARRRRLEISRQELQLEADSVEEEDAIETVLNEALTQVSKTKVNVCTEGSGIYCDASEIIQSHEMNSGGDDDTIRDAAASRTVPITTAKPAVSNAFISLPVTSEVLRTHSNKTNVLGPALSVHETHPSLSLNRCSYDVFRACIDFDLYVYCVQGT